MTKLVSRAFFKFRFSLIALQWGGNLLALVLAAAWLQVPDSHAWQFVFSMISAAILIIGFCWLQIATFHRFRPTTDPASRRLRILGFALVAALWLFLAHWISSGANNIPDHAYLWNSKLSPGMRIIFSPTRLIAGLSILLDVLVWAVTALLLPIAVTLSTEGLYRPSWRGALRPYRRIVYWIAVFLFCILTTHLTSALVSWTPGKGVSGQVLSVVVRLAIAYTTDILLWCLLLAFTAAWMEPEPAPLPEPAPTS